MVSSRPETLVYRRFALFHNLSRQSAHQSTGPFLIGSDKSSPERIRRSYFRNRNRAGHQSPADSWKGGDINSSETSLSSILFSFLSIQIASLLLRNYSSSEQLHSVKMNSRRITVFPSRRNRFKQVRRCSDYFPSWRYCASAALAPVSFRVFRKCLQPHDATSSIRVMERVAPVDGKNVDGKIELFSKSQDHSCL